MPYTVAMGVESIRPYGLNNFPNDFLMRRNKQLLIQIIR